ncbi:MAG: hypothetical protein ACREL9_01395 [Gemmatimonadales bacterium]
MPVTAKLSRKFYDTFGDELTNELVEWFNQVDLTYRMELRELNELNFSRFDAKLEQRAAQLDAKLEQRIAEVKAEVRTAVATLETRMAVFEARILKWMFLFWIGTLGTLIALQQL